MFCPKCHTELEDGARYCKRCGTEQKKKKKGFHWNQFSSSKTFERMNVKTTINKELEEIFEEEKVKKEDHNETHNTQYNYSKNYSNVVKDNNDNHGNQYTYSQNYSNASQKQITSDQDYLDAYIGLNAEWIEKQNFSILTAFFGPFYLLYRKLWTQAIILLIIYICSYLYIFESLGMILRIFLNILMAIRFKEMYVKEIEKRVEQIKRENPDKTSNEILEICKNNGGTWSFGKVVVVIILYIIGIAILSNQEKYTYTIQKEVTSNQKEILEMKYRINDNMVEKDSYTNYKYYIHHTNKGTCYTTITAERTNKSTYEFLTEEINIYDSYKEKKITDFQADSKEGSFLTVTTNEAKKEYYAIKNDNIIYEIKFEDTNYSENNCEQDKNSIFNSMEWK